jgi:beta-glucanase (GH16 family)
MKTITLFFFMVYFAMNSFADTFYSQNSNGDTTFIRAMPTIKSKLLRHHNYHQTLTLKLFLSQARFDGKLKRRDNGQSELFLTYEQALDVIRKIDNLSLGMPKIIYLVGWQYNGHDSKYPAFFDGNPLLKRKQDSSSLQSLTWLMKESSKFNTTISLHINMLDAYEDSPLWDEYVKNDIIAKNVDGSLRACEWGWPISYAQEWKTGYAQKRIDSLCKLLPIQVAGTIHIDAFHTWAPVPVVDSTGKTTIDIKQKGPISPYLNFTVQDETAAQKNIFNYWASKGIDVTSESVDFLRETAFEGYQPMAWWFGGLQNYLKWPASYYCGGQDNSDWGKLFGTSMHGEDIVKNDPIDLSGFQKEFSTKTAVWYYLNQLEKKFIVNSTNEKSVHFSENVFSSIDKNGLRIKQGDVLLVEDGNVLIPATWLKKKSLLAYSKNGYKNKEWVLPETWSSEKNVNLFLVSMNGKSRIKSTPVSSGKIVLSLAKDEMILIEENLPNYQLVWSDEFNTDGVPDSSNWTYEKGFVRNEELQWYQPENASCKDGILTIEVKKENKPNPSYKTGSTSWKTSRENIEFTSACLISKGKQTWKYGRFEMRAKIDISKGMWPAWWTLGVDKPWPANGEIDIMEYYRGKLLANVACLGNNKKPEWFTNIFSTDSLGASNWSSRFHTWRMDWTEECIELYLDDQLMNKVSLDKLENKDGSGFNPFKQPHYMLLNFAIGGMNGGDPSNTTFPRKFEVDYVRVYEMKNAQQSNR